MRDYLTSAILIVILCCSCYATSTQTERLSRYAKLLGSFVTHPDHNESTQELIHEFMDAMHLEDFSSSRNDQKLTYSPLVCAGCKVFFKLLPKIDSSLVKIAENLFIEQGVTQCLSRFGYTEEVCKVYSQDMAPYIVESIQQRFFDPDFACPLINVCPQVYEQLSIDNLVQEILDENQSDAAAASETPTQQQKNPNNQILRILHLTDIHMDPEYQENMPVTCNYPICCRNNQPYNATQISLGDTSQPQLSGYWGTLATCDLPERTFDQFVNFVAANLTSDIDLILWTGDNISHDQSNISLAHSLNITTYLSQKLREKLNVPVIGSFGNNDAAPDYIYDFLGNHNVKFQDRISDLWKPWIDDSAYLKIREHGFYATRVPELPNLKIISLNTFACVEKNYFLLRNSTDQGNQLQWLRKELGESEKLGESVYIIGHIPMMFCNEKWGRIYQAIAERYSKTIKAQIFGHTHSDQYSLISSVKDPNSYVGVQFIAPSLTTIGSRNPSFRVLQVDSATYDIVDYDQYRLDLQKYNTLGPLAETLEWEKVYSFKAEYNLTDLSLTSLRSLAENLATVNPIYYQMQMNYNAQFNITQSSYNKALYCATTVPLIEELAACRGVEAYSSFENKFFHVIDNDWRTKITKEN